MSTWKNNCGIRLQQIQWICIWWELDSIVFYSAKCHKLWQSWRGYCTSRWQGWLDGPSNPERLNYTTRVTHHPIHEAICIQRWKRNSRLNPLIIFIALHYYGSRGIRQSLLYKSIILVVKQSLDRHTRMTHGQIAAIRDVMHQICHFIIRSIFMHEQCRVDCLFCKCSQELTEIIFFNSPSSYLLGIMEGIHSM